MTSTIYGHCELGVDYSTPPHELPTNAFADSKNVVPNREGLATGRGGQVKLNNVSLASRLTSFHEYKSGTDRDTIVSYSTKIAVHNSATGEFDDKITGLTSNKMYQWTNFGGYAIGVNGVDAPQSWNGSSGTALAGSPPVGVTIANWGNRVWYGGDSTNVAVLTGSDLNTPISYTSAGTSTGSVSQIVGDSKDPITGIYGYFDLLLVGKQNTIYKVSGDPPTDASSITIKPLYSKTQEQDNVGFTSKWAITQVANDIIFLDGFDIRSLTGIQEYGDVKYNSIIPDFRDYLEDTCNKDLLQYSQFFHYKKSQQIWVSMPITTSTHYVFVLDYKFKHKTGVYAVFPMGEIVANVFGGVENGVNHDLYFGDETGFAKQLDVGNNDDGVAIERYFTKVFAGNAVEQGALGYESRNKQFLNSETFMKCNDSTLTMKPYYAVGVLDAEQSRDIAYTALDTEDITGWLGTGVKRKRVPFFGVSTYSIAIKWLHETINENFTFYPSKVNFTWKTENLIV